MEEDSLLKRSLVLTGTVVGLSMVWVALVSVILVFATDRAVTSLSGGGTSGGGTKTTVTAGEHATDAANQPTPPRGMFSPNSNPPRSKPNG
jgi:lipid-binding SYLF domain-containing protein